MEHIDQLRPDRFAVPGREAQHGRGPSSVPTVRGVIRGEGFGPRPIYPRPLRGRARQALGVGGRGKT
jgi:hypothetical protein